jgi:hypothetical protein
MARDMELVYGVVHEPRNMAIVQTLRIGEGIRIGIHGAGR